MHVYSRLGLLAERITTFRIDGLKDARQPLTDWKTGAQIPSLWTLIGTEWRKSRLLMAQSGGASTGFPWVSYSETPEDAVYGPWKIKTIGVGPLGWAPRERLLPSLYDIASPWCVSEQRYAQPLSCAYGTTLPYAVDHDRGGAPAPDWAGGYPIPRRPLTEYGPAFTRAYLEATIVYARGLSAAHAGAVRSIGS